MFNEAQTEFAINRNWVAYNTKTYYLDHADMWFFRYKDEATQFANDNVSDEEAYAVIYASSVISLMRQLPYGEDIRFNLSVKELEDLFQSFDWSQASYDPLHDLIHAVTKGKDDLARIETLLIEWEHLYRSNPEQALQLAVTYWEGHPMENYKDDFLKIQIDLMNEKNYDYLKDNLRNMGFGEKQHEVLAQHLKDGKPYFTLTFNTEVSQKAFQAVLKFDKPEGGELYFFNSYQASMQRSNGQTVEQTFYLNNGYGITAKEAFNMLDGRAVYKEFTNKEEQKYKAWVQLDFKNKDDKGNHEVKQFHDNYGYDLKAAVAKYAVAELDGGEKEKSLLKSLEKGNVQSVTIVANGEGQKMFLEANPQYKTITVYDGAMHRVSQEQRQELLKGQAVDNGKDQSQAKEQKQDQKKANRQRTGDDLEGRKKKKSRSQGL